MAIDLANLKNINLDNVGVAPLWTKALLIAVVCVALLFMGYWLHHKNQLETLNRTQAKETELKTIFEGKAQKVASLDPYKVQLEEMNQTFGTLLRQLPSKTEIPALIVDISQTGLASGLEIELFKPGEESRKAFYAEKPINLRMKGSYHQFGAFASEIAALPRIVTLHNISLSPDNDKMVMTATARTYRYLGENEE